MAVFITAPTRKKYMKIKQVISGEPVILWAGRVNYLVCCSCGLKHLVLLDRRGKYGIEVRMFKDEYGTRQERKKKK